MTTDDLLHRGKRSWWDGTVTTLCGRTMPDTAESVWFPSLSGRKRCPTCETVHRSGRRH